MYSAKRVTSLLHPVPVRTHYSEYIVIRIKLTRILCFTFCFITHISVFCILLIRTFIMYPPSPETYCFLSCLAVRPSQKVCEHEFFNTLHWIEIKLYALYNYHDVKMCISCFYNDPQIFPRVINGPLWLGKSTSI